MTSAVFDKLLGGGPVPDPPPGSVVRDLTQLAKEMMSVYVMAAGHPAPSPNALQVAFREHDRAWELSCKHPVDPDATMFVEFTEEILLNNRPDSVILEAVQTLGKDYLAAAGHPGDQQTVTATQDTMKLYDYQRDGVEHLLSGRFRYLADEMGLGKSVQAIVAINESGAASAAVICPAAVVPHWEQEWADWGDSDIMFHAHSYASAAVRKRLVEADIIVLDEAHYCKNRKAKRTNNALAIASRADRGFLLSGTPGRNMGEMWAIFNALWPEEIPKGLENYEDWEAHFCTIRKVKVSPRKYINRITGHHTRNIKAGRDMMQQVLLRRTIEDVALQLPELRVTLQRLPKTEAFEKGIAKDPEVHALLQSEIKTDNPSTSRIRRLLGSLKAPAIADQIGEELNTGAYKKIVIGYYHRDVGNFFEHRLREYGVMRLDGHTSNKDRKEVVHDFNHRDDIRVFLGQMHAAGVGINLQAANEVVLVEPAWTPSRNRQFIKRVHRIGSKKPCRARIFAVADTQDERVMRNVLKGAQMEQEMGL